MKVRLADYVADFLVDRGVTDVFSVVGGGAMHLNDAIKILQTLKDNYKNYSWFNPQDTKGCPFGYLKLSKDTECGLYDKWNGGGSVLEIALEKDVKIPLHFITSIDTDEEIQEVYGLCGDCWRDTVMEVA